MDTRTRPRTLPAAPRTLRAALLIPLAALLAVAAPAAPAADDSPPPPTGTLLPSAPAGDSERLALSRRGESGARLRAVHQEERAERDTYRRQTSGGDGAETALVEGRPLQQGVSLVSLPEGPYSARSLHLEVRDEAGRVLTASGEGMEAPLGASELAWTSSFTGPGVDQAVLAATVWDDGTGPALYIGGEFRTAGEHVVHGVARWDGVEWAPLTGSSGTGVGGGFSPRVSALVPYDGGLVVAGQFERAGGSTVNNIARWDGSEWSALEGPSGVGVDNWVNALTVYDGELIAGGQFTNAGGVTVNRIARWNGSEWAPLTGPSGTGIELGAVDTLTVYDGALIVGGLFLRAGGLDIDNVARWDGSEWSALTGSSGSGASGWVFALTPHQGDLIVAGSFAEAGGVPVNRVARWDGAEWSALGGGIGDDGSDSVRALTVYGGELIAGGSFAAVDGTPVHHLARWDGSAWLPLAGTLDAGASQPVAALTAFDGELVVGGTFDAAGGRAANHVVGWDGVDWAPLEGASGSGPSDWVLALTVYEGELIAGGSFRAAGDAIVHGVARWEGDAWVPLTGSSGTGVDGEVMALAVYDGDLIVGGEFREAGGVVVNNIARWDGSDWSPLVGPAGTGVTESTGSGGNGWVDALLVHDGGLIAGGDFVHAGGLTANSIARWDGSQWSPLGSGMNAGASAVNALTELDGDLIAGGTFPQAGGVAVNHVARWDGSQWSALGGGMNDTVFALAAFDGELVAGGPFTQAGGTAANHIARWDGGAWSQLGGGVSQGPFLTWVGALTVHDGALIAGGPFSQAGGVAANFIARWDGSAWSALSGPAGNGVDDTVFDLTTVDTGLLAPPSETTGLRPGRSVPRPGRSPAASGSSSTLVAGGAFLVAGGVANWGVGFYAPSDPFTVTPDPLAFGAVQVGETRGPLSLTLTNGGTADVTVSAISDPETPFAAAEGTCDTPPFALAPGASCIVDFTFTPAGPGDASTTVTVDSDSPSGPHTVTLSGTGSDGPLHVAPDPLDFGGTVVGETHAPLSVTLTNAGPATVNVSAVSPPAAPFAAAGGTCGAAPFSLPPFASCTLAYTFTPTAGGGASATVEVLSDAASSPDSFGLAGEGLERELAVAPDPLDLGGVDVGETSATHSVTLTNTGTAILSVHEIGAPEEPFVAAGGTCGSAPLSIPAGASCTLDYTFTPPATGPFSTTVTVTSDAPSGPQTVTLQGLGTGAALALDPEILAATLDEGETMPLPLSVGNEGNEPLEWDVVEETIVLAETETTITHSESLEVLPDHTLFCGSSSGTAENRLLRTFVLPDFGIPSAFQVTEVTFGVQVLTIDTPITVNLYTLDGELEYANLTLIGTATRRLDGQSLTLATLPVTGRAPAGSTLVAEIVAPDLGAIGETFIAGSNDLGESAPSYVAAPSCGNPEPTPFSELGRPDVHLVMAVTGLFEPLECELPAWAEMAPTGGTVPGGETQEATATFDAGGLASGIHRANLCLSSNDPLRPLAVVPLELTVSGPFPVVELQPTAVDFDVVALGQSGDAVVTLSNAGDGDLAIEEIVAPDPPFAHAGGTCQPPQSLAPGASCTIDVRFAPTAEGSFSAGLDVVSNAITSPDTVTLVGIGFDLGEGVDKVTAADGAEGDRLGNAAALAGDTALVGAMNATVDGRFSQGAAYVLTETDGAWAEQTKLTAGDGAAFDSFGSSVALDGDTAVIGAPNAGVDGNFSQGAAYVFVRDGDAWTQQAKLTLDDGASFDNFGFSVALAGDTAVVGAQGADVGDNGSQGAAYVFTRDGTTWSLRAMLTADDGAAFDNFGSSAALDGDTIMVGAVSADSGDNNSQGAAYVFTGGGDTWSQQARLTASDGAAFANFGRAVAVRGDTALVGADGTSVNGAFGRGAAYVFTRDGEAWSEQAKLVAADGAAQDQLGRAVALTDDTALVGAWQVDEGGSVNQGAAYLFTHEAGIWSEAAKFVAADGAPADELGFSVALGDDVALAGAPGADAQGLAGRGAVYLFSLPTAGAPELAFDPSSLDFGDVEVGTSSEPRTATLANTGDADATGLVFSTPGGGFEADTADCGFFLAPGESCDVVVTFTPPTLGSASAELQVDTLEGATTLLALAGNGVEDTDPEQSFTAVGLEVDPAELTPEANGLFEPGETVDVAPAWRNDGEVAASLAGTASDFTGPEGAAYSIDLDAADYGLIESDGTASCLDTEVCYRLGLDDPAARPAAHWDATFDETLDDTDDTARTWTLHIGESFADVPTTNPFYPAIETLLHSGITGGCTTGAEAAGLRPGRGPDPTAGTDGRHGGRPLQGGAAYCPGGANSRAQMPVFVLRALEGDDYTPLPCVEDDDPFGDVPFDSTFCPWIQDLASRGIVSGCGNGDYCPGNPVSRAQMAIFLLKTLEGADYEPAECAERFTDVACPSLFADWIEDLAERGITGGCTETEYCPADPVTRAQMAVFVIRTFGLTLYGP